MRDIPGKAGAEGERLLEIVEQEEYGWLWFNREWREALEDNGKAIVQWKINTATISCTIQNLTMYTYLVDLGRSRGIDSFLLKYD